MSPPARVALGVTAVIFVVVAVLIMVVSVFYWLLLGPGRLHDEGSSAGLRVDTATQQCRAAIETEARRRADNLAGGPTVLVSVTGVELYEPVRTAQGWSVDGTAQYTLTTGLLPPVAESVPLTCEASLDGGGQVITTVGNRGS